MSQEQILFFETGENLCGILGPDFSGHEHYKTLMEGCFTQNADLMAKGLEQLASSFANSIPLFLRGKLLLVSRFLRGGKMEQALEHAASARQYATSLGLRRFAA